jgi:hypothetical protein
MHIDDDEFETLGTKPKTENSRGMPSAKATTADLGDVENLAVNFNDDNLMKREGLEICRPDQDRRVRFTVLHGAANPGIVNPQGAWVHFIGEGKNGATYRCLATKDDRSICPACAKGLKRSLTVACLVAQYLNADPGTGKMPVEVAPQIALKVARLSQPNHNKKSNPQERMDHEH